MTQTIGLIIDIALILLLVVFGIIGLKKGFLKSLLALFSWIVCIAISIFAAKYVANWINGIYDFSGLIGTSIANGLSQSNPEYFNTIVGTTTSSNIISTIPNSTNGLLGQVIKVIFSNASISSDNTETIAEFVGITLGNVIMLVVTAILLFILLKLAIFLLSKLFDNITRIKILGGINKLFGFLFGLVKAGCVIIILNCVLVCLSLIPAVNDTITPVINDNTHIERVIYNKTDEVIGKYVIEGEMIQNWISDLWESR